MDWEKTLMDAFVVAVITASATVLAAIISSVLSLGRVNEKIESNARLIEKNKDLLSKDHNALGIEHKEIRAEMQSAKSLLNKIENELSMEKQAQSFRYENLDDAQKEIRDSVRKTFDLLKDWERVITENKELKEKIKAMEREMEILKEKTANLERKNKIRGFDRDM